ncbi:MAG: DUF1269 domain-containing protein [Chloroflexota bacterium]|nr:MAG: DUF1269 domain-containing protein [Chloroflexota bacterium]
MSHHLILGVFAGDTEAAVAQLDRYNKSQDEVGIAEAVAIVKTADGEDEVKLMGDPRKKARRIGAVAGGMLGLLGGPVTAAMLGAAGGAVAGDLIAKLTHSGVSKEMINAVEEGLEPGSSAVVVIVEEQAGDLVVKDLKRSGANVVNEMVESEVIEDSYLISPSHGRSSTQ